MASLIFRKVKTSVEYAHHAGFQFQLKRSTRRRRTLSLSVREPDKIIVSAPWKTPIAEVHRLLDAKKAWIQLQLEKTAQVAGLKLAGDEGDKIFYLGKPLSLRFCQAAQNRISIIEGENEFLIHHTGSQPNKLTTINKINKKLRAEANSLLPEKVAFWSEKMNLKPANVRIKQYKARWGSCSRTGEVQLNWRLIGASEGVIDYVVVHELAHLKFFNHSAGFWTLVGNFQPDYKGQKRWLKEFGSFLML